MKVLKKINLVLGAVGLIWLPSLYFLASFQDHCYATGTSELCEFARTILVYSHGVWIYFLFMFSIFNLIYFFLYYELYKIWTYFSYAWITFASLVVSFSDAHDGGFVGPSSAEMYLFLGSVIYVISSIFILAIGIPVIHHNRAKAR